METIDILTFIGGLAISVITYFLKQTMSDLKQVKEIAYETKSKLNVLESNYVLQIAQLNEKIEDLKDIIKDLTKELKNFNENKT